jgi:hypothetical protein
MKAIINQQLEALAVPIQALIADPDNARDHDERNVDAIRYSLQEYGQQKPIVIDSENVVIAGNGTLTAAKALGWERIAAVRYDGEGLPEGYALADNRTAELAHWNYEHLTVQLKSLQEQDIDLDKLGWKDYELEPLFKARWTAIREGAEEIFATDGGGKGDPVKLTIDQRTIVNKAIAAVRKQAEQSDMSEGRAVELVCADYLAGLAEAP